MLPFGFATMCNHVHIVLIPNKSEGLASRGNLGCFTATGHACGLRGEGGELAGGRFLRPVYVYNSGVGYNQNHYSYVQFEDRASFK